MLALVYTAASGAPRAQSVSRASLDPDSGTVCISTAVHMKTAQCNLDCNAPGRQCPKECLCSPAKASLELSFGMPSDSFASLVSLAAHGVVSAYNTSAHKTAALHRKAPEGHHHVAYNAGQMPVSNARARRRCLYLSLTLNSHLTLALTLALSITPTPSTLSLTLTRNQAKLPKDIVGSYMKTWSCKDRSAPSCKGPADQNINVVFSGYSLLAKAMTAALNEEVDQAAVCTDSDLKWCDSQVDFMVTTTKVAKDREEAIQMALKPDSFLQPKCKPCYAPKPEKNDTSTGAPFSQKAGLYQGLQFLSVGGANRNGLINAQRLEDYSTSEGLDEIKAAGFEGVCFDVESTEGEEELVTALERAFAACKRAGLLVMVTTSHTAPYAAASDASKPLMVDSWAKSNDIDIFSPQLYTSGREGKPEYDETPCASGCSYDRLKKMKARWVPSVANPSHYPAVKDFLNGMGIQSHGYLQWQAKAGKP
jgi:hypothetical protein